MLTEEEIVAIAVSAVAEETGSDTNKIRVVSFTRIHTGALQRYVEEHNITYKKYELEDEVR